MRSIARWCLPGKRKRRDSREAKLMEWRCEDKLILCSNWFGGGGGSYLLTVKRVKARQVGARRKNKSNVREITRLGNRVFYVFENWPTVSCIIFVLRGKILVDRKDRSQRCEDTRNLRKVLFSKRTKWLWIREEFFFLFI